MGRILAISDIHGMYDEFERLMSIANYDPGKDKLILLGDYVDRGSKSIKTIQRVMELASKGAVALMGNHEQMVLDRVKDVEKYHMNTQKLDVADNSGVIRTIRELYCIPDEERLAIVEFMSGLKKVHREGKYIFAHAGYNPSTPFESQNSEVLLWSRDNFFRFKIPDDICIVFGHTPTNYLGKDYEICYGVNSIGIDCGSCFGGKLACLSIDGENLDEYYVKCE